MNFANYNHREIIRLETTVKARISRKLLPIAIIFKRYSVQSTEKRSASLCHALMLV